MKENDIVWIKKKIIETSGKIVDDLIDIV